MYPDYFKISSKDLGKDSKIPIKVLGDTGEVFYEMAVEMIKGIKENEKIGKHTVFICPVGPTGQYPIFVRLVNEMRLSLKNVYFINMDEYLDDDMNLIDINNPLSFRGYMKRQVYDKIDPELVMPEGNRIFPEPGKETYILDLIKKLGGVDICFGGIGINGHVAFNEPPEPGVKITNDEFKNLPTRKMKISRETRTINSLGALSGAISLIPKQCITIGFKEILMSKKVKLYCFRDWHRSVVRQGAYGDMTCNFPVSLLQEHNDVEIVVTANVAQPAF